MADATEATAEDQPPPRRARDHAAWFVPLAATLIAIAFLFAPLKQLGIWDPYELDAADLARRIAIWSFPHPSSILAHGLVQPSASDPLWLEGAQNALPTLGDLHMGELPFTSMALSFRLFGLHEWTGRLPLALWGLAGALALYTFIARLIDRRAALYATAALVTMPLYFLHARTMLGDIVTMAALTFALAGLGGALLDRGLLPRVTWLLLGIAGLVAGYLSRGLLIGVAIPALSVGLTALALQTGPRRSADPEGAADGPRESIPRHARPTSGFPLGGTLDLLYAGLLLGLGLAATLGGVALLRHASPGGVVTRALAFTLLARPATESTFDLPLRDLGHALFPWSAFLPFAVGRLFRPPSLPTDTPEQAAAHRRETGLRVLLLVALGVAFTTFALLGPRAGSLPWSGPVILAAIAALAIRDFERGAPPSRALALGTLVLGYVLVTDLARMPDKALAAFSVDKPSFPKSFEGDSASLLLRAFAIFAGLVALVWLEGPQPRERRGFLGWVHDRTDAYAKSLRELYGVWAGNLVFVAVVIEAALVGLGAMVFAGRRLGWSPVERLPKNFADLFVNVWWVLPFALATLPVLYVVLRDAFRVLVDRARTPRALFTILAALVAGGLLSFGYYPALAAQLSPKEAFETLAHISGPGEPLGLLGVRARAAAYYGSGAVTTFTEPGRAFTWLTENQPQEGPTAARRWLLFKADDLPKLNSLYRRDVGKNLPVLDGRSSQILLGSNLARGAENQNPLGAFVLDDVPHPARVVDASFRDELTVLGWEVRDESGALVDTVVPQTKYHIRFYYRVEQPISGTWKAFLHIDGFGRRYNGDHAVLDGRYATNLWNPGDHIVDELAFQLEPNFLPGDYTVFFGFFSGDTRYAVVRGSAQDNRVIGGPLRVR